MVSSDMRSSLNTLSDSDAICDAVRLLRLLCADIVDSMPMGWFVVVVGYESVTVVGRRNLRFRFLHF
jgi:hypothetical protein